MTAEARRLQMMPNKAMRILIADKQHFHSMQIERELNRYGYYRIAPVHSLDELLRLVEYASEAFDLLIINASLPIPRTFDLLTFCRNNSQLKHALIYAEDNTQQPSVSGKKQQRIQLCPLRLPEAETIKNVLRLVDPATQANRAQHPNEQ
ncbi:response regulator [Pseudomonas protegens]|jgi:PleD family two-component response regulator|uniref:response regulator n=1 Tax=Pseudomonas protegens TaxID=380021 RepID=UPI003EB6B462